MAALALVAVEGFSTQLGSLGASHSVSFIQYLCCFKREKRKLENTLSRIRNTILDLQTKQERSHAEEDWLQRLQEILEDGQRLVAEHVEEQKPVYEDAIDSGEALSVEVNRQVDVNRNIVDKVLRFFSTLWFHIMLPYKMKEIRDRLDAAVNDHSQIPTVISKNNTYKTHKTLSGKTQAIGREEDKEAIKKQLKESSDKTNVSIIPIVAMGGMGKTTLAKVIYENEEDFELKMWVDVSSRFDKETPVENVIEAATGEECPKLNKVQLEEHLRKLLDGKKYMLVLDDVWESNNLRWTPFQDLLMGGARGSLILVTTRDKAVGQITSNTGEPYILEHLSEDSSWFLFEQEACKCKPGLLEEKLELLPVGKEILDKCGRNPLAIKTVARLLSNRRTISEWLEVKNDTLWELAEEDTDILPSLRVSYQHLPPYLQKCFAHCTLFPKGYRIEKATLIQLWMAEELIQPSKIRILEDIGEDYFKTLLNRNFFENEKINDYGNIRSCKMHDLMHDLAQIVAGMDNYSIIRNDDDWDKISEGVIHASISKQLRAFPTSTLNAKNLRTFISTAIYLDTSKEDFAKFALTFESLRVLGLVGFDWGNFHPNVLDPIGNLKQLRYLDLSYGNITTLSNSVCELQNLQTLKLRYCVLLTELPTDIKKLESLRHLENYGCFQLKGIPCGIGQLTCIQTLPLFVLGEGAGLCELETLNNLRGDLEIRILKNAATSVESRKACLKEKQHLQTLKLDWLGRSLESNGVEDAISLEALQPNPNLKDLTIDGYGGVSFPSWMLNMGNSLPYLVQICLFYCPSCVRFPLFADLRCLKELKLSSLDSLQYIDSYIGDSSSSFSSSSKGWFPSLKKVYLQNLPKLKEWTRVVNDGGNAKTEAVAEQPTQQLLSLKSLEIMDIMICPELTSMPLHPNVEELELHDVSGVLIESMTMAVTVSPTSAATSLLPSSFTFSKLKSLKISWCKALLSLGKGWLENLTSLERLEIWSCPDLNFSDEDNDMPVLRSLHSLKLSDLPKLAALPKVLQHSTALETLEIEECPSLMTLPDWFGNLTSLRQLTILNCTELNFSDEDNDMPVLKSLHSLRLSDLPKLAALPKVLQHSTALETLEIRWCPGLMTLPDWFGKLTSLRQLTIFNYSELKSLGEGWLENLTSLERLQIGSCPKLESLPQGLQHLTALKNLEIWNCPELNFSDEDNDMPVLKSLHSLELSNLPKLVALPKVLQHSTALENLKIGGCPGLMTLPDWIGKLKSLRELEISDCSELKSLPERMRYLTSLEQLTIRACPHLSETCRMETGKDWLKIAHIPEIEIDLQLF